MRGVSTEADILVKTRLDSYIQEVVITFYGTTFLVGLVGTLGTLVGLRDNVIYDFTFQAVDANTGNVLLSRHYSGKGKSDFHYLCGLYYAEADNDYSLIGSSVHQACKEFVAELDKVLPPPEDEKHWAEVARAREIRIAKAGKTATEKVEVANATKPPVESVPLAAANTIAAFPSQPEAAQAVLSPIPSKLGSRRQVALVIGIDKYRSVTPLANAVADARSVAEALRKYCGFETRELYDEQATRAGILAAARQLVDDLKEGDNLLIYYAGHGWEDAKLKEGYWIPVDAREQSDYVSNAELHKHIDAMEKAQHVFIVADSCFSGAFLTRSLPDRSLGVKPTDTTPDANALNEFFRKMDNRKSRLVLTSGANEPVADGGRDGHSIFAYYLLRALNSPDEPVFNAMKLTDRVQESVANNSAQTPLTGVMKSSGDEKGQMIFFWRE